MHFCSKILVRWQGPTNGNFSFCKCRLNGGDAQLWWEHSKLTCSNQLHLNSVVVEILKRLLLYPYTLIPLHSCTFMLQHSCTIVLMHFTILVPSCPYSCALAPPCFHTFVPAYSCTLIPSNYCTLMLLCPSDTQNSQVRIQPI